MSSHTALQLLQKTGQIDRTVDREFTDEEAKYRVYVPAFMPCNFFELITICHPFVSFSFEKECQALQKDSKAYWDAMRGRFPQNRNVLLTWVCFIQP